MRITLAWLKTQPICFKEHIALFEAEWGDDGVEVSRATLLRSAELGFRMEWVAERLLPADAMERWKATAWSRLRACPPSREARIAATDALQIAIAPALARHNARLAAAKERHDIDRSLVWFRGETADAYAECRKVTDPKPSPAILAEAMADVLNLP